MHQNKIVRQMLEFNKDIFDSNFKSMALLQDQTENFVFRFLEKATWIPDDGKKAMNEWLSTYKKGRETFKDYTDESYKKATDYLTNLQSQEERQDKGKA